MHGTIPQQRGRQFKSLKLTKLIQENYQACRHFEISALFRLTAVRLRLKTSVLFTRVTIDSSLAQGSY